MILVKAGSPVDATIDNLIPLLEKGDIIIDGGNEWYENTEKRKAKVAEHGLLYLGMGVSGGEEGARNGMCIFCLTVGEHVYKRLRRLTVPAHG
jgi:6-phosphogluconate dehydrogenase